MHPHLTVILADRRAADIRARLALRVARPYADLRTAR
jgi:hypothetical protein